MGPVRALVAHRFGVVLSSLILVVILPTSPADASGAMDLQIFGPGMRSPVLLRWADLVGAVEQVSEWRLLDSIKEPTQPLGVAYDVKVFLFLPSSPPKDMGAKHWTYYPETGLFRTNEKYDQWLQARPPIRSLLERAIRGEVTGSRSPTVSPGEADVLGMFFVLVGGLLALVIVRARRQYSRARAGLGD